jgi:hypothetical protein
MCLILLLRVDSVPSGVHLTVSIEGGLVSEEPVRRRRAQLPIKHFSEAA